MTDAADLAAAPAAAAPEPTGWENPPRVARTNTAPVLSVDGITGPLDWPLDMARARKLDLARPSIGALIGQFATALSVAPGRSGAALRIDYWAWLDGDGGIVDRTLVAPGAAGRSGGGARRRGGEAAVLRRRLLARARMRDAADWLARRPQLGRDVFARGRPAASGSRPRQRPSPICCAPVWSRCTCRKTRRRRIGPGRHRSGGSATRCRICASAWRSHPTGGRWRRCCPGSTTPVPAECCAVALPSPAPWSPGWNSPATAPSRSRRWPPGRRSGSTRRRVARPTRSRRQHRLNRRQPQDPDPRVFLLCAELREQVDVSPKRAGGGDGWVT